jgi:hypothetical protein
MARKLLAVLPMLLLVTAGPAAADYPDIAGWTPAGSVQTFGPGDLWEYINGAADLFLAYGFQLLEVRDVSAGGVTATVNIYDMGTPLNAFGIYATEAPKDSPRMPVGISSVVAPPYQALLLKDRFYVKVDAREGDLDQAVAKALLSAIAAALPGSNDPPEALALLPEEGMVQESLGFSREGFLGLSQLRDCVHATYVVDEREFKVFIMGTGGTETPRDVWTRLGGKWTAVDHPSLKVLARKIPYRGLAGVALTERGIVGVSDCSSKAELLQRLERFAR